MLNFGGQKRIGDGRTGGTDHVQHPPFDLTHHGVGACESTDADNRLAGQIFDEADVIFLRTFGYESRAACIGFKVGHIDVP